MTLTKLAFRASPVSACSRVCTGRQASNRHCYPAIVWVSVSARPKRLLVSHRADGA